MKELTLEQQLKSLKDKYEKDVRQLTFKYEITDKLGFKPKTAFEHTHHITNNPVIVLTFEELTIEQMDLLRRFFPPDEPTHFNYDYKPVSVASSYIIEFNNSNLQAGQWGKHEATIRWYSGNYHIWITVQSNFYEGIRSDRQQWQPEAEGARKQTKYVQYFDMFDRKHYYDDYVKCYLGADKASRKEEYENYVFTGKLNKNEN